MDKESIRKEVREKVDTLSPHSSYTEDQIFNHCYLEGVSVAEMQDFVYERLEELGWDMIGPHWMEMTPIRRERQKGWFKEAAAADPTNAAILYEANALDEEDLKELGLLEECSR